MGGGERMRVDFNEKIVKINPQPLRMQWEQKELELWTNRHRNRNRNLMTKPSTLVRVQICNNNESPFIPILNTDCTQTIW